jgi:hypothetical protein
VPGLRTLERLENSTSQGSKAWHHNLDRIFDFEDARGAYDSMGESRFMGKIVIRIP